METCSNGNCGKVIVGKKYFVGHGHWLYVFCSWNCLRDWVIKG